MRLRKGPKVPINPLTPSAPLPRSTVVQEDLDSGVFEAELVRAKAELLHALGQHRSAWAVFADLKRQAGVLTNPEFLDNERAWKEAVSDVQWWRGEVNARANSVLALTALVNAAGLGPEWAEATSFGDVGKGVRTFVRRS